MHTATSPPTRTSARCSSPSPDRTGIRSAGLDGGVVAYRLADVELAGPGDAPGAQDIRCFLAQAGQGVNYARGTWHHPLIAIDAPGDFLVIDRGGPAEQGNCDEIALKEGELWLVR